MIKTSSKFRIYRNDLYQWIKIVWNNLSDDIINKSFDVCGYIPEYTNVYWKSLKSLQPIENNAV